VEAKRIAVIGPESSGKSWLCQELAGYFGTSWVEEFARGYMATLTLNPSPAGREREIRFEELTLIARRQILSVEEAVPKAHRYLFCDTDLHNICVWSEYAFQRCDPWLARAEENQHFDLYLLLKPDIPWIADGIRQNPHLREELFARYEARLIEKKRPYVIIRGEPKARLHQGIKAIRDFF